MDDSMRRERIVKRHTRALFLFSIFLGSTGLKTEEEDEEKEERH